MAEQHPLHKHHTQMAGGLKADQPVESHVKDALQQHKSHIQSQLGAEHSQTFEPLTQRSQVVAGMKYYVKVKTGYNKYAHVGLWRKVDQTYEITDVKEAKESDELGSH